MYKAVMDSISNFKLIDPIFSEAYLTTMITCLICENDLMASDIGVKEANDPMEIWAKEFSQKAKLKGWSVSTTGSIVCPNCGE